jgi:hypothetical protein
VQNYLDLLSTNDEDDDLPTPELYPDGYHQAQQAARAARTYYGGQAGSPTQNSQEGQDDDDGLPLPELYPQGYKRKGN